MERKNGFIYYQRVQDDSVPYHIKQINLSELDISRPTVIEFTGSGAVGARAVNGHLKNTESQLGEYSDKVNIIGIDYNASEFYVQIVRKAVEYSKEFIEKLLVPLSLDENGNLNVDKACKNLRNITFKTHCMGHEVVYNINSIFKKRLNELGYSEAEAKLIMSQILEISYGSEYVPLDFSQVYICSLNDGEVRDRFYPLSALMQSLDDIEINAEDKVALKKLNDGKIKGKTLPDFFKENERVYVVNNGENALVFCFSYPVDNLGDDHSLYFARINKGNKKAERATNVGFSVAKSMSSVLRGSVENSMQNIASDKLILLDLDKLKFKANEEVKPLNKGSLVQYSEKGEE